MNIKTNYIQDIILLTLENGVNKSTSRVELIEKTGVSDRKVRKNIEDLRHQGIPILSSTGSGGYYLPSNKSECERYIKSMENRAKKTFMAIKGARNWLETHKDLYEQEQLKI